MSNNQKTDQNTRRMRVPNDKRTYRKVVNRDCGLHRSEVPFGCKNSTGQECKKTRRARKTELNSRKFSAKKNTKKRYR